MPDKRRVLLADDDDDLREIVGAVLQESGFDVTFASDGREALARARDGGVDVMVLDQRMPGLLGTEVAAQLRAAGTAPPIVLVTASANVRALADAADIHWFVGKPFGIDELITTIERASAATSGL